MNRCKICDKHYEMNFFSHFPDENYCFKCEAEILVCIWEMDEMDDVGRFDTVLALREAGCSCPHPLLGFKPGVGPRCRLCNTVAQVEEEVKDEATHPLS